MNPVSHPILGCKMFVVDNMWTYVDKHSCFNIVTHGMLQLNNVVILLRWGEERRGMPCWNIKALSILGTLVYLF